MALWRRLGSAGFESSIYRRKRWYSVLPGGGVPSAGRVTRLGGSRVMEEPFSGGGPMFCYTHFRSFVASEQAKPKPKVEGKGGDWRKPKVEEDGVIRLNEAIKEVEVRLVTEQGHRVVPIQEALYLARKLDVDLVEVQRKVKVEGGVRSSFFKPAVCKLMDYYKEKYKQDLKGKERAKSKAAIALRNGENKEVRFKAKTELKDLKIKAESVKRLMERGYRVKCTAMPTGKDDENLGGLLLSLLSLIEDIAAVESGPHLDTKNAYVIVKHVKFASKKGKKLSKVMETVSSVLSARTNAAADDSSASKEEVDSQTEEEWETVESDSEIESEGLSKEVKTNTQYLSGSDPTSPKKVVSHTVAATEWSGSNATYDSKPGISFNNTKHTSSKFDVVTSASASHASEESINKAGGRNPSRPEPSVTESNRYSKGGNTNQIRRSNRDGLFPGKVATGNQGRMPEQTSRNESEGRAQLNPKDRPAHTYNPDSSFSRYGVFGASRSSGSNDISKAGAATMGSPNTPNVPQQRYGVFTSTKSSPSVDQRHLGDIRRDRENKTNSPTSSYGVFNTPKTISSEDQMKLRDASRDSSSKLSPGHANTCSNGNSPSPRFGIFTSSKKASYVDSSVSEKN